MCTLEKRSYKKKIEGYKVVAVKKSTGKRYSIAMGFCYDSHKEIPVVTKQKRISTNFIDYILNKHHHAYETRMVGRTAICINHTDAERLRNNVDRNLLPDEIKRFFIEVLDASVSKNIMTGTYGFQTPVAAGRVLTFD